MSIRVRVRLTALTSNRYIQVGSPAMALGSRTLPWVVTQADAGEGEG